MAVKLYNSLTRKIEELKPIKKNKIGLYACGPTVYNYAHIGNLRTYVFEDILKKVLKYNGFKVKHIMNITDVGHLTDDADQGEDKMEKGAKREGKTAWEIAKFYEKAFKNDLKDLNIEPPNKFVKATQHIKEQIKLIKKLEKKGFTYKTSDGIYFNTSKLKDYGKLANLQNQKLKAGARVNLGEKKNITDFALWKFSQTDSQRQMEWTSPWGVGFPGWHIECSAMSTKYLGQPFDIHCGGIDHIPVHHTNEIAQSEAAEEKPMANYWLHGEFLLVKEGKMAKSDDNFLTLSTLKQRFNPLAYRYFLLQTKYRKQLNFSNEALIASENGLNHLYQLIKNKKKDDNQNKQNEKKMEEEFLKIINNDLDTPEALAFIYKNINELSIKSLLKFDRILGLDIKSAKQKNDKKRDNKKINDEIKKIMEEREQARKNNNWKKSDELRDKLKKLGYGVKDSKTETTLFKL